MMTTEAMSQPQQNDVDLVAHSIGGDQDAFRQIVERYQTLICSLAYCATGNVSQSEDLAQETFVAAWKELPHLREPAKLRSWLCGIVRFRIGKQLRQQGREPVHAAEPLETMAEFTTAEPLPSHQAINNEENAILWRSLERIPETYREPLVLFYREHQSVERVAEALDLSEDAVKQRLSRGRKLLQEEFLGFMEGALARTTPGKAFTIGVVASLPLLATSAQAATIGLAAAKSGATTKAAVAFGVSGFLMMLPAVLSGVLAARVGIENSQSLRERQFVTRMNWTIYLCLGVFFLLIFGGIFFTRPYWKTHSVLLTWGIIGLFLVNSIVMGTLMIWSRRTIVRIRKEEAAIASPADSARWTAPGVERLEYRSKWTLFGLPLIHVSLNCKVNDKLLPAKGWIAVGNTAYGILFAAGAIAVGAVSIGGFSVGIFTFGAFGLGIFAFGGTAVGIWALGGLALGYMAYGGAAIAWQFAYGGASVAHHFALGGSVIAPHANDAVAEAFARDSVVFSAIKTLFKVCVLLSWIPSAVLFVGLRLRKKAHQKSHMR